MIYRGPLLFFRNIIISAKKEKGENSKYSYTGESVAEWVGVDIWFKDERDPEMNKVEMDKVNHDV